MSVEDHEQSATATEAEGEAQQDQLNPAANDYDGSEGEANPALVEGGGKKKKKKRKKKKAAGADAGAAPLPKNRGSGFEDNFADPPMTAEEAEAEKSLYSPERPFFERIETCIQRYVARRRFSPEQKKIFDLYLFLGGIDSSPRQFGGAGDLDTADMSKQEIRDASTSVAIPRAGGSAKFYRPGDEGWDVDFLGIVQGFICETLLAHTGFDLQEIRQGIQIVENFLRYVATHDVCPEYELQLRTAIEFFPTAWRDLCACWEAMCCLPGEFNDAASKLYKSALSDYYGTQDEECLHPGVVWATVLHEREKCSFDHFFRTWKKLSAYDFDAEEDRTFEVVDVLPASEKVKQQTTINNQSENGKQFPEFGSLVVRDAFIQDSWCVIGDRMHGLKPGTHTFYFQLDALKLFHPGMKIRVHVARLRNGIMFITKPYCVMPNWYVFLPQNLMMDYKEPGPLAAAEAMDDDPDETMIEGGGL